MGGCKRQLVVQPLYLGLDCAVVGIRAHRERLQLVQLLVLGAERRLERLDPLVGETPNSPSQGIERRDHTGRSGAREGAAQNAVAIGLLDEALGDS